MKFGELGGSRLLFIRNAVFALFLVTGSDFMIAGGALAQQPRIDSVSPSQGPIAGGTVVTISGSGFSGSTVTLDQNPITPASISDNRITLTMPPHDNGYALIQVTSGGTGSAAELLYVPPKLKDLPPGYITTVAGVGAFTNGDGPCRRHAARH